MRQTHIQDRMRDHIDSIRFHPVRNRQFLLDWMDNISIDWPISRRRWYHTEIPIWYSEDETKSGRSTCGYLRSALERHAAQGQSCT